MKNYFLLSYIFLAFLFITGCKKDTPVVNFNITGGNCEPPCEVTFTNTTLDATSYLWDFGDGGSSNEQNPVHTYTTVGTFTVKLTATNNGGSAELTKTVTTVDPCASINCLNGGTCSNGSCACAMGYEGDSCQTKWSKKFLGTHSVEDIVSIGSVGTYNYTVVISEGTLLSINVVNLGGFTDIIPLQLTGPKAVGLNNYTDVSGRVWNATGEINPNGQLVINYNVKYSDNSIDYGVMTINL